MIRYGRVAAANAATGWILAVALVSGSAGGAAQAAPPALECSPSRVAIAGASSREVQILRAVLKRYDTCRLSSVRIYSRFGKRTIELVGRAPNWNTITRAIWEGAIVAGGFDDLLQPARRTEEIRLMVEFPSGRVVLYQALHGGGSFVPTTRGFAPRRLARLLERRISTQKLRLRSAHLGEPVLATAVLDIETPVGTCPSAAELGDLFESLQQDLIDKPRDTLIDGLYVTVRTPSGVMLARIGYAARLSAAFSWRRPASLQCQ